jgi:hypothetical protein
LIMDVPSDFDVRRYAPAVSGVCVSFADLATGPRRTLACRRRAYADLYLLSLNAPAASYRVRVAAA